MKKHWMLGSTNNRGCFLISLIPFDDLVPEELEPNDFIHYATNWCGQDSVERALTLKGFECTGRYIKLSKPLVFRGSDSDWGHEYPWEFSVQEIWELEFVGDDV